MGLFLSMCSSLSADNNDSISVSIDEIDWEGGINVTIDINELVITGDADGDGIVGINDVIMTIDASLGNLAASFKKESADLDGDGIITINDVIMLIDLTLNQ